MASEALNYKISDIQLFNEYVTRICLIPIDKPLQYAAGQYVLVSKQNYKKIKNNSDARGDFASETLPLSIACAHNQDDILEFHIAHSPDADHLTSKANVGDIWNISGPMGECNVKEILLEYAASNIEHGINNNGQDNRLNQDIVFIAWGTGFAPYRAMIEYLLFSDKKITQPIHLFLGSRGKHYAQEIINQWLVPPAQLNFDSITVTYEEKDIGAQSQKVIEALIASQIDLPTSKFYISGSFDFVGEINQKIIALGAKTICSDML